MATNVKSFRYDSNELPFSKFDSEEYVPPSQVYFLLLPNRFRKDDNVLQVLPPDIVPQIQVLFQIVPFHSYIRRRYLSN